MTSCASINKVPPAVASPTSICLIYSKKDFLYYKTDTDDTKERMRNNYAAWKAICE